MHVFNHLFIFVQFRFAECKQILLMIAGTICGLLHGAGLPMLMVVFGDMVDLFLDSAIENAELDTINWADYDTTKDEAIKDQDLLR